MNVTIKSGDADLMVQVYGSARDNEALTPLVLVMGLSGVKEDWGSLPLHLCRDRTVVLIDNRGMGQSSGRVEAVSQMASDVRCVLEGLKMSRVHLLGLSMGGFVVQQCVVMFPHRIASVIIVSSSPGIQLMQAAVSDDHPEYPLMQALVTAAALPREQSLVQRARGVFALNFTTQWISDNRTLFEEYLVTSVVPRRPAKVIMQQMEAGTWFTAAGWQQQISSKNVLVIHGTEDFIIPVAHGRWMAQNYRAKAYLEVEGGGHLLHLMFPRVIETAISSFLRSAATSKL